MKRVLSIVLFIAMCFSLAACDIQVTIGDTTIGTDGYQRPTPSGTNSGSSSDSKIIYQIQTDSMEPAFSSGDWVICPPVDDPSTLVVGDIIAYWTIINGERVVNIHRIVAIYDCGGFLVFETRGDSNPMNDPMTVHQSEVIGKFTKKLGW